MSKWMFAVVVLAIGTVAAATADDAYQVYNFGSGALYGAVNDPYSGPTPSGMRFGDAPHVSSNEPGGGTCQNCFGVGPHPCDPCWRGPCIDWKLIGWYSHWGHGGCGHKKRCCASLDNCRDGAACDSDAGACVTCR